MGRWDYYRSGDYNGICEVCGQKYKFSKLRKRWDGVVVCPKDWEPRHPQDFVKGVPDNQSVPLARTEATDSFIPWNWTLFPEEQDPTRDSVFHLENYHPVVSYVRLFTETTAITDIATLVTNYSKAATDTQITSEGFTRVFNGVNLFSDNVVETDSSFTFSFTTGTALGGAPLDSIPLG